MSSIILRIIFVEINLNKQKRENKRKKTLFMTFLQVHFQQVDDQVGKREEDYSSEKLRIFLGNYLIYRKYFR